MICWSNVKRTVGKVDHPYRILDTFSNELLGQPIYIVREATHDEWLADVVKRGGSVNGFENDVGRFYYEVSAD